MVKPTRDRLAKAIGTFYDGYADPIDTPANWNRAVDAVDAVLDELVADPSLGVCLIGAKALGESTKATPGQRMQDAFSAVVQAIKAGK